MAKIIRNREELGALFGRLVSEQQMLDDLGEQHIARDLNIAIASLADRLGIPLGFHDIDGPNPSLLSN